MLVKKKKVGDFRGPTPKKIIQTVDVGSGTGEYPELQAIRHRKRRYVVVDPKYEEGTDFWFSEMGQERLRDLKAAGVEVKGDSLGDFVDNMIKDGVRARHFNVDIIPLAAIEEDLEKLFGQISDVLLPNGKVFFTSDQKGDLEEIQKMALRNGLKTRKISTLPDIEPENQRTWWMRKLARTKKKTHRISDESTGEPYGTIYRLEVTHGLKKAFPEKTVRKNR